MHWTAVRFVGVSATSRAVAASHGRAACAEHTPRAHAPRTHPKPLLPMLNVPTLRVCGWTRLGDHPTDHGPWIFLGSQRDQVVRRRDGPRYRPRPRPRPSVSTLAPAHPKLPHACLAGAPPLSGRLRSVSTPPQPTSNVPATSDMPTPPSRHAPRVCLRCRP